jgi:aromatic ring-opening dioxygenase catalytic subunit (LigB family)
MLSAHWEAPAFTVQTHPHPPMLYDYGGFPDFTYRIQYPAPGAPDVARRVRELLAAAGIDSREDAARGFDHGMFAPMAVAWPKADMPVLQLSLKGGLDPAQHLALGRALAPLRDEGILIVGSGLSYHNLRAFGPAAREPSAAFDGWLESTLAIADAAARAATLAAWERAPAARLAHPREEHLLPLMVALGAAEHEAATRVYHERDFFGGITVSSFRFG